MSAGVYTVYDFWFEKKRAVVGFTGYCINHACVELGAYKSTNDGATQEIWDKGQDAWSLRQTWWGVAGGSEMGQTLIPYPFYNLLG